MQGRHRGRNTSPRPAIQLSHHTQLNPITTEDDLNIIFARFGANRPLHVRNVIALANSLRRSRCQL